LFLTSQEDRYRFSE